MRLTIKDVKIVRGDKYYIMQEAWEWDVETYKLEFDDRNSISPDDYRKGRCLYQKK